MSTHLFTIFLFISIISYTIAEILNNMKNDVILQVHVSFRHGDRTMNFSESYSTDPNRNTSHVLYPLFENQLTNVGKQRAYKLGKMLRKRYNIFLGDLYDAEIVKTLSTDFDRTKMTAQLLLAGLFPPSKSQQWDDKLMWLPIPVDYMEKNKDTFLRRNNKYCPKYNSEFKRVLQESTESIFAEYKDLIEYIEKKVEQKIHSLKFFQKLFQIIYIEDKMNLPIPEWMIKIYPEPLGSLASKYFQIVFSNTLLKRLNGGHIWKKILIDLKHKVYGSLKPKGRKIYLYSGHRKNAINLLTALDLWDNHLPQFCAATIVELVYKNQRNEYGIQIYYFDQKNDNPNLLTIPGCNNTFCEFSKFVELIKPVIPENYTMECGSPINLDIYP